MLDTIVAENIEAERRIRAGLRSYLKDYCKYLPRGPQLRIERKRGLIFYTRNEHTRSIQRERAERARLGI